MMKNFQRIVLIVLDSLGVGEMPDAADLLLLVSDHDAAPPRHRPITPANTRSC